MYIKRHLSQDELSTLNATDLAEVIENFIQDADAHETDSELLYLLKVISYRIQEILRTAIYPEKQLTAQDEIDLTSALKVLSVGVISYQDYHCIYQVLVGLFNRAAK